MNQATALKNTPNLFVRAARAILPTRSRFAFYYYRRSLTGPKENRRENLARMYAYLGVYRHKLRIHGDVPFVVDVRDEGIGIPLFSTGTYEPIETAYLRDIVKPGQVFVDIGANIGVFTALAARLVGPAGRVIAIEPSPYNFRLLCRNVKRFRNTTPLQLALGESPSESKLNLSSSNFGDNRIGYNLRELGPFDGKSVTVQVDSLDNVLSRLSIDRVDCIKIDVQGFEAHVLEGMRHTLKRVSTVCTEFWPSGITAAGKEPERYLAQFQDLGFHASVMNEGGLAPISYSQIFDALPKATRADGEWVNLVFHR